MNQVTPKEIEIQICDRAINTSKQKESSVVPHIIKLSQEEEEEEEDRQIDRQPHPLSPLPLTKTQAEEEQFITFPPKSTQQEEEQE